jgi:hypothetical protein
MKQNGLKFAAKAKDFEDKEKLKKSLDTLLKKPLKALLDPKVKEKFNFCYEVDYFGPGEGFMSIGKALEIDKIYKTKRSKGQGTEGKVDKKKVAFGECWLNDEGIVEFNPIGGLLKFPQLKIVIKSIKILKMKIGVKFAIVKGAPVEGEESNAEENESADADANANAEEKAKKPAKKLSPEQKEKIKTNMTKINAKLQQIAKALKID